MSWGIPAVLKQRFQHAFPVSSSDLLLVDHLVDHLLSDAGQGLLFTVEYRHTWWKIVKGDHKEEAVQRGCGLRAGSGKMS